MALFFASQISPCPLPLQVRELLNETGQVLALWMPAIKTHCYAVLESQAQAEATRRVRDSWRLRGSWRLPIAGACVTAGAAACAWGAGQGLQWLQGRMLGN